MSLAFAPTTPPLLRPLRARFRNRRAATDLPTGAPRRRERPAHLPASVGAPPPQQQQWPCRVVLRRGRCRMPVGAAAAPPSGPCREEDANVADADVVVGDDAFRQKSAAPSNPASPSSRTAPSAAAAAAAAAAASSTPLASPASPASPAPTTPAPTPSPSGSSRRQPPPSPSPSPPFDPPRLSRTLLGRIVVEVFSLLMGGLLFLFVVLWRFSQLVALNIVRAISWLAGVRRLSRWAYSRLHRVHSITLPAASLAQALRRVFMSAVAPPQAARRVVDVDAGVAPRVTEDGFADIDVDIGVDAEENVGVDDGSMKAQRREQGAISVPTATATATTTATDKDLDTSLVGEDEDGDGDVVAATPAPQIRRLILLRHANTLWDRHTDTPDHDRVLSTRGKTEARVVGSELARLAWLPDVVLCSDAVRTVQTLSLLDIPEHPDIREGPPHERTDASPSSQQPRTTCMESLYYAVTGDEMAMAVDNALGEHGFSGDATVMVVCHNPGCEELVEQLTGQRPEMATACAALLESVAKDGAVADKMDEGKLSKFEVEGEREEPFTLGRTRVGDWRLLQVIKPSGLMGVQ